MRIKYSGQAQAFLDSQNAEQRARIKRAIKKLPKGDIRKLKGRENAYRLRVGNFRVIFERNGYKLDILVADNRGDVY